MSEPNNETELRYCICRSNVSNVFMIMCDNCEEWYHGNCVGVTMEMAKRIDRYCCVPCSEKDPLLTTTYKADIDKIKTKPNQHKRKSNKRLKYSKFVESDKVCIGKANNIYPRNKTCIEENNLSRVIRNTERLDLSDMTNRRVKPEVKESNSVRVSSQSNSRGNQNISKVDICELKQCYGPGCTKAARKGSKYCSDACGIALGKNRILEILPSRCNDWHSTPCAADEESRKKLSAIRTKLDEVQTQLEAADIKIIHLIDKINKAKKPGNFFVELQDEDTSTIDCVLCATEVQVKSFSKHLEQCYRRQERKIFITENTVMPDDVQWNVFCNHRISKHMYCKKLRVLCPLHYKDFRKDNEVCGYPLAENDGVGMYCGNVGKTCSHVNWEEIQRAELDLEKLNLLIKFNKLKEEERKIRKEMAFRGNCLGLMLHQTITHY